MRIYDELLTRLTVYFCFAAFGLLIWHIYYRDFLSLFPTSRWPLVQIQTIVLNHFTRWLTVMPK